MEIRVVDQASVSAYISFCKSIYRRNIYYRDSMSRVLTSILKGKAEICKNSRIVPIMVLEEGRIAAVCTFAIVDRMKDTLQLTYFEALPHQDKAVEQMITYGKALAKAHGIKEILIGLNFHVNYGLGLLADQYEQVQGFGSAYNPSYYIDYFQRLGGEEFNLVSYVARMKGFDFGIKDRMINKINKKYQVRKASFKEIKREAGIYTELNNQAFQNHKFYYERRTEEDLELFQEFKLLLREENLLFLEHNGKPIGFMLWYPDYHELMGPGESLGIKTLIKHKLCAHKIRKFKIVELGILPEYQKNGAVFALFHKCREFVGDRYDYCESGWILEHNRASRGLGYRWADKEYKHFKVFRIPV
ncbi:GNAT family N-acetyltransferase [Geosporobacter ferrireducens]|uniref:N-acetyltransferase domain-containing protein n=1 Tax=Geosporobacter ferrireducens TaxID=1424294 RepID=A0A1D8GIP4_9FIRM|nr:GNAT family N-acetyltransferase [Geosporobacter ferrireducens]AOT70761.1 hypothetical protein Gferi_14965 [Geosporobacter ferrireducens]MTI57249.1 GNAT family N-acetyltransferase [Geosporobacter ferrireducens]